MKKHHAFKIYFTFSLHRLLWCFFTLSLCRYYFSTLCTPRKWKSDLNQICVQHASKYSYSLLLLHFFKWKIHLIDLSALKKATESLKQRRLTSGKQYCKYCKLAPALLIRFSSNYGHLRKGLGMTISTKIKHLFNSSLLKRAQIIFFTKYWDIFIPSMKIVWILQQAHILAQTFPHLWCCDVTCRNEA